MNHHIFPRLACKVIMSLQWICFTGTQHYSSSGIKEIDAFLEDSNLYHENCMIKLREDITAAERQEVEEFLLSKGSFLYFNTILENTEKEILNEIKRNLPLPLFLLRCFSCVVSFCFCNYGSKNVACSQYLQVVWM